MEIMHGDEAFIYVANYAADKSPGMNYAKFDLTIDKYDVKGVLIKSNKVNLNFNDKQHWYIRTVFFSEKLYVVLSEKSDKKWKYNMSLRELDTETLEFTENYIELGMNSSPHKISLDVSPNYLAVRLNGHVSSALSKSEGVYYRIFDKDLKLAKEHLIEDPSDGNILDYYFRVNSKGDIFTYAVKKDKASKMNQMKIYTYPLGGTLKSFNVINGIPLKDKTSLRLYIDEQDNLIVTGIYNDYKIKECGCGIFLEKYDVANTLISTYKKDVCSEKRGCPLMSTENSSSLSISGTGQSTTGTSTVFYYITRNESSTNDRFFASSLNESYIDDIVDNKKYENFGSFGKQFDFECPKSGDCSLISFKENSASVQSFKRPSSGYIMGLSSTFSTKSYTATLALSLQMSNKSKKYKLAIINH